MGCVRRGRILWICLGRRCMLLDGQTLSVAVLGGGDAVPPVTRMIFPSRLGMSFEGVKFLTIVKVFVRCMCCCLVIGRESRCKCMSFCLAGFARNARSALSIWSAA